MIPTAQSMILASGKGVGPVMARALIVGGGGGKTSTPYSGDNSLPGSAGGRVRDITSLALTIGTHFVTIGAVGGFDTTGGTTSLGALASAEGGGSGGRAANNSPSAYNTGGTLTGTPGTATGGYTGGAGHQTLTGYDENDVPQYIWAGGGGAGAAANGAAVSNPTTTGGAGGAGLLSDITGTSLRYGAGGPGTGSGASTWGSVGTLPTGWGNPGSGSYINVTGYAGVVILRYLTADAARVIYSGSKSTATDGAFTVMTITGNGTLTISP